MKRSFPLLFFYLIISGTVTYYWGLKFEWELSQLLLSDTAALAGLIGFVTISFQLVTSARWRILEERMGLDKLLDLHRRFGILAFFLLALHGLFFATTYILSAGFSLPGPYYLMGIFSFIIICIAVATALFYKRLGMSYEASRIIHLFTYIAYGLGINHSLFLGSTFYAYPELRYVWYLLGFAAFVSVVKNIMRKISFYRVPSPVTGVKRETRDITTLNVSRGGLDYFPGQFVFLGRRIEGKRKMPHPFTIASNPEAEDLSFSIKGVGDFTKEIAEITEGDEVYIEGPYGRFTFADNPPGTKILLIAGGIGITPFMSNLRSLKERGEKRDIILLWGNKTPEDIPFTEEIAAMDFVKTVHIFSDTDSAGEIPGAAIEYGFVTGALIDRIVPDVDEREVFLCGPPVMMEKVTDILSDRGYHKSRIRSERFSL